MNYKEGILKTVTDANEPLDVEKIRCGAHIGNWNTALKHCLELLIEGRLKGIKTSKGWIFWIEKYGEDIPHVRTP